MTTTYSKVDPTSVLDVGAFNKDRILERMPALGSQSPVRFYILWMYAYETIYADSDVYARCIIYYIRHTENMFYQLQLHKRNLLVSRSFSSGRKKYWIGITQIFTE